VVAVFGPSTTNVILIVAVTLVPHFGRVARAQVLAVKSAPFLEAERILGASTPRIIAHHILPNIMGPLIVLASMDIPVVITIEAGLSFIGLGVRPPLASWGTLIYDGYSFLSDSRIPVVVSSAALAVATLGFTLFGEALRDAVDPRLRSAQ
jgi:peptide/nickel transport system permease protein